MNTFRNLLITAAIVLIWGSPAAYAASVPANVTSILSGAYGGSFTATADGFTNGTVTATASDVQTFAPGDYTVTALARYAWNGQAFGYAETGSAATTVTSVAGSGTAVSGAGSFTATDTFAAIRSGGSVMFSSVAADNFGGIDHMLAYEITGTGSSESIWALFFEDIRGGGDLDFDDLVVEMRTAGSLPTTATVPTPAAGVAGLMLMLGIAAHKNMRRRRLE